MKQIHSALIIAGLLLVGCATTTEAQKESETIRGMLREAAKVTDECSSKVIGQSQYAPLIAKIALSGTPSPEQLRDN